MKDAPEYLTDEEMNSQDDAPEYLSAEEMGASSNDLPKELPYSKMGKTQGDLAEERGIAQGVSFGFRDEIEGAIESPFGAGKEILNKFGGKYDDDDVKRYKAERDESRRLDEISQGAHPGRYGYGTVGGSVLSGGIGGAGKGVASLLGRTALSSGATGVGATEKEDLKGIAQDAALSTGIGLATAGTLVGAGKGVNAIKESKLGDKLGNWLDEFAENQAASAMGAERGSIKKLGADKVRDVGRYALDEGIVTPFASTDDLITRNEKAMNEAMDLRGAVYGAVDDYDASTFNPIKSAVRAEEKVIGGLNRNYDDTKQLIQTLDPHLSNILSRGEENISMKEAQILVESLRKRARFDGTRSSEANDVAKDVYFSVRDSINDAASDGAEAIGVPGLKEIVQKSNKQYSTGTNADTLLENKYAREYGNKMFGLTDTVSGAGAFAANPTAGTVASVIGAKKTAEKYGNQIAAVTADKISDIVRDAPHLLGKFGPVLQKAQARGKNALGATHFVLQQTNPEYRALMSEGDK